MADEKSNQRLVAQLPRLEDDNFELWKQSLTLIARGLAIHKYLERDNKPDKMSGNARRLYYLLANTMLTSMSDKVRHIAMGGGMIQDLDPKKMVNKLTSHYLPLTKANDIQLRRQLYTKKMDQWPINRGVCKRNPDPCQLDQRL